MTSYDHIREVLDKLGPGFTVDTMCVDDQPIALRIGLEGGDSVWLSATLLEYAYESDAIIRQMGRTLMERKSGEEPR